MAARIILGVALLALVSSHASASDPSPLQDFCVADYDSNVFVNGFACKKPKDVTADDFYFTGLDQTASTANRLGANITLVTANRLPGLNTLGVAMSRVDYAPFALNPPHSHPHASEILHVAEGTLYAGFVTSNTAQGNRLFAKKLKKGDAFVFPQGLIHFQFNAAMGSMDGIIDTVSVAHDITPLMFLLEPRGKLIMAGAPAKPLHWTPFLSSWVGEKSVAGTCAGGVKDTQEMIDFAAEHNIAADIELVSMDRVNEAMERLGKGDVRYRFVIDIGNTLTAA
ncbi:germin-like protein [Musa troglodytarum]|uniref:Germin-like protein n=1 Tax=Musa troglodytarum TaxID=320322 RepID=A0A9E7HUS3_9LILI|nr:germin-like protein [Musa troglodytarum]